jgi:hypothetical protein
MRAARRGGNQAVTARREMISKMRSAASIDATFSQPHLDQRLTKISVSLDLTIHRPTKGGKDHVGGVMLLFSRGETSTNSRIERSKIIAGLIYTYGSRFLAGQGDPEPSLCLAVDMFGGVAHAPPGTFARKLRDVEDACGEIAASWKTIAPPDDDDGPDPY